MHKSTFFNGTRKYIVGLALMLMPAAYSCSGCNNNNGDNGKKDSTMAPMQDSSKMHMNTDSAMKQTDTGHRGDQNPPPNPHHP